jgi:hypothetical protein
MRAGIVRTVLSIGVVAMSLSQARAETHGVDALRARVARGAAPAAQPAAPIMPARYESVQAPMRIIVEDEGTAMERTMACLLVGTAATAGTVAYAGQGLVAAFTAGVGNQAVFGVLLGGALFMTYCSIGMVLTPVYVRITRGNQIELPAPQPLRTPPRAAVQTINAVAPLPPAY